MGWGPGTQVGSYEILAFLGNGGMGEVYKVRHLISQRLEAMKILLSGSSQQPEVAERFLREIRVLANLSHPNIAALHTAFHHGDQLIMVMEFVEGTNLGERLRRGLTVGDAVEFTRQVLSALVYAHSTGVIHRDIKPSNIMVSASGTAKLLDFGLARASTPDARITSPRSLIGSLHYISPEQIRGETPDARTDLYALGVTLYELLTGRLPVKGDSVADIIRCHLQEMPPAPATVNRAIPESLSRVVMRSLEKNPAERFQNASEFLGALNAASVKGSEDWAITMERTVDVPSPLPSSSEPVKSGSSAARSTSSPVPHDKAVLEDISQQLAAYIGPIAKVIVKRASGSSSSLRELCDKVAAEIESENSRKRFLNSVQKHLRASSGF